MQCRRLPFLGEIKLSKKILSGLLAFTTMLSVCCVSNFNDNIVCATESIESVENAKSLYLRALDEAKSISSDEYSADSFATYNAKLSDYDVTNILDMYSNPYTSYDYEKLIQGIECAKQFLISDKSHTYYNDLKNLISYGENINPSDYTEESYSAFKTQFDTLLSGNFSLENAYSLEEAGNGADIYHYYISQRYATCFNLLVSKNRQDINITDELTGVSLVSNTDVISSDVIFAVDKFNHDNWNWTEVDLPGLIDIPNMCSNYEYYSFNITDADNNRKNITAPYTVEIPVNNEFDIDNLSITIYKNNASKGSIVTRKIDKENRKIILTFKQNFLNYANGAAIMIANPIKAIDPTTLEDGIYSIDAELTMYSDASKASMANSALNHDAFIVKSGDSIDTYMNFNPIYVFDVNTPAFCGGLWSEKGVHDDGEYYSDSETILSCYTNEDGSIRNNDIYNGVTEIPCIKAIKLHLERECYNQYGGYTLAVSSPTMAAMSNTPFEEMKMDTLTCNLMISKPLYLGTIEEASSYLPLYDKSALLRKIKQVELKFAANKGEAKLEAALAEANKVYTAKYEDAAAASKAYEAAIAKLDEFEAGYDMTKNLPDGKYIVHADMVQLNRVDPSMSDAAINHDIVVNVKDGKATVQVEFKGLAFSGKFGYLSRLWNYDKGYTYSLSGAPIGTKTEAKVLSKYDVIDQYSNDNPPHYLEFELVDGVGAEWVPLHVYVPVMTGSEDQDVNMHIDWSTARKAGEIAEYTGNTLSLKDDFGLNFFFNFGEQTLNDAGAKVKFTLPDGSVKEYVISEIADADKTANGYKFSANVAAKEMTAPVKVQVILSNGETSEVFSCSVKEYADKLLASSTNESEIALVKSILNYGGYAQEFFGYNKTALANADLTDAEKTLGDVTIANTKREKVDDEDDGINFYGSSLSLNTKIDLKAYFTLEDGAKISDYTFKIGSTELTPVESGNKYYVTIPDITSRDIDERSAIEIANKSGEGELSVKTGPYAYIYKALSKSSDEKLQSLMKALYFYSQAAENYNA